VLLRRSGLGIDPTCAPVQVNDDYCIERGIVSGASGYRDDRMRV